MLYESLTDFKICVTSELYVAIRDMHADFPIPKHAALVIVESWRYMADLCGMQDAIMIFFCCYLHEVLRAVGKEQKFWQVSE